MCAALEQNVMNKHEFGEWDIASQPLRRSSCSRVGYPLDLGNFSSVPKNKNKVGTVFVVTYAYIITISTSYLDGYAEDDLVFRYQRV